MSTFGTLSISPNTTTATPDQTPPAQQKPPPPPPAPPAGSSSSGQSPQLKAKIAAIYAQAETSHESAAEVQQQINAAIADTPSSSSSSSTQSTIDYTA